MAEFGIKFEIKCVYLQVNYLLEIYLRKSFLYCFLVFSFLILSAFSQSKTAEDFYNEGVIKVKSKNYLQAIGDFTSAISLKQTYAEAYLERAKAKQLFAQTKGFESYEFCHDLIMASQNGSSEAKDLLHKLCEKQCFQIETAFFEPDLVFCADFSNKVLFDMPKGGETLTSLVKLNLFNNKMVNVPKALAKYKVLSNLDFSSNKLTELDNTICSLTYLKELNMAKNQITLISENIGALTELQHLFLHHNQISEIPKTIGNLEKLESLDLSHNNIHSLPQEFSALKNLKTLILVGNEISAKEQNRIKSMLPNCNIYF